MVPNHNIARSEALVQIDSFDHACRDLDAQCIEFTGQRADDRPVEGWLMETVVDDLVLTSEHAFLAAKYLQK